jgi:hypothetical protein
MISLEVAQKLKEAGLNWEPALHDFFAIPDRGMDERIFVISDMMITLELLSGMEVVSFQGASEWALDYLLASEVIWMPREEQLREALVTELLAKGKPQVSLKGGLGDYRCAIMINNERKRFSGKNASQAYASALLYLMAQS